MAKKRGAKPAGTHPVGQPAPRARRPTDETRDALAEAMNAVVPSPSGPTEATKAAIADVSAPRNRAVSGEIDVPQVTTPRAPTSPGVPLLAAPVIPASAGLAEQPRAGSDSVIVLSEAMAPAATSAAPPSAAAVAAAPAPARAAAQAPTVIEAAATASTRARSETFSDDDEKFFSSEVSDHTLTLQREREEAAKRPWWRRWLGW